MLKFKDLVMILTFIFLLIGCNESQIELEIRCRPILQKIIDIQHERDIIRKDFSIMTRSYRGNKENKERWLKAKNEWLEREGKLALEVNDLYVYSYETGCLK